MKKMYMLLILSAVLGAGSGAAAGYITGSRTSAPEDMDHLLQRINPLAALVVEGAEPDSYFDDIYDEAVDEPEHRYLVGVFDGYVAVFYTGDEGAAAVLTSTPVNTLPADDQRRITNGIKIYTDEQLAKILQDYGS
jgi:hypothetical protein